MDTDFAVLVDQRQLQEVMARYITGVAIVTSTTPQGPVGLTVSSFTSVSFEPPTVLACMNRSGRVYHAVSSSRCYAINVLAGSQAALARRFALPGLDQGERFQWLEIEQAMTGSPLIMGCAAWLDCRLDRVYDVGTHGIFIGEVLAAGIDTWEEAPLMYHQRAMGPLR